MLFSMLVGNNESATTKNTGKSLEILIAMQMGRCNVGHIARWSTSRASIQATGCRHWARAPFTLQRRPPWLKATATAPSADPCGRGSLHWIGPIYRSHAVGGVWQTANHCGDVCCWVVLVVDGTFRAREGVFGSRIKLIMQVFYWFIWK